MSHRIKVFNGIASKFDSQVAVTLMKRMEKNNSLIRFRDNQDVLIAPPNHSESNKLINKYSKIAKRYHLDQSGFALPIYTSEAYLSLWNVNARAGVHTDSNNTEWIMFSTVLYLNDDYDGGEIYFPNQGVEIRPQSGDMVIFPSGGHEYFHGVKPITSGKRYTIAMWHTMHEDYSPFDAPDKLNPLCRGPHPL